MERDERTLDEIQFALDTPEAVRMAALLETRAVFREAGAETAQDIVDLGCTGLAVRLHRTPGWLRRIQDARANMGGSLCGLPCYVPPDRFCLVHNTIGGLQQHGNTDGRQETRHPEGLALCSRELTDEEKKHAGLIKYGIEEMGRKAAGAAGLEVVGEPATPEEAPTRLSTLGISSLVANSFTCPEHTTPEWRCRFCLAQAIVAGPFEPSCIVRTFDNGHVDCQGAELSEVLENDYESVELFVRAAVWKRKLIREG